MSKPENPDIFYPLEVPQSLLPYVRRVLVTDSDQDVDMQVQVGATGYNYFGWTWRGAWQANMNGVQIFDTDTDGPLHMTGQVRKSDVYVRLHRDIATMFLEFTALGHFQLLGVTGAQLAESATAPEQLNPALKPAMEKIRAAQDMSRGNSKNRSCRWRCVDWGFGHRFRHVRTDISPPLRQADRTVTKSILHNPTNQQKLPERRRSNP